MNEETNIIPVDARELHSIEFLAGLDAQLIKGQDTLKDRLSKIPGGWRNYRLGVKMVEKTLDEVYKTIPVKTLKHMRNLALYGEIVIRKKPMIKMPDDVQIVQTVDLKYILNRLLAAECAICVKNHADQKGCKLRKALENIAPSSKKMQNGHCPYIDVVLNNELEDYI